MANETIYGCVNWTTGVVTFEQDACNYAGCMEWSGVHAGQVALVLNNNICNDTYYGCIDWSNDGKFEISIPEDCCCNCAYRANDCTYCHWATNESPQHINVTFSGIKKCSDDSLWASINRTFCLAAYTDGSRHCTWRRTINVGDVNVEIGYRAYFVFLGTYSSLWVKTNNANYDTIFADGFTDGSCHFNFVNSVSSSGDCSVSPHPANIGYEGTGIVWDDCPCDSASSWIISTLYSEGELVIHNSMCYQCIQSHTSSSSNEPGAGANWEEYWIVV